MNKPLLIKLANRIKELRKQQKITQDELAYRANIGRSTLGNIETAQNDVTFSKINQLAQAFELSLSEFLNFLVINKTFIDIFTLRHQDYIKTRSFCATLLSIARKL